MSASLIAGAALLAIDTTATYWDDTDKVSESIIESAQHKLSDYSTYQKRAKNTDQASLYTATHRVTHLKGNITEYREALTNDDRIKKSDFVQIALMVSQTVVSFFQAVPSYVVTLLTWLGIASGIIGLVLGSIKMYTSIKRIYHLNQKIKQIGESIKALELTQDSSLKGRIEILKLEKKYLEVTSSFEKTRLAASAVTVLLSIAQIVLTIVTTGGSLVPFVISGGGLLIEVAKTKYLHMKSKDYVTDLISLKSELAQIKLPHTRKDTDFEAIGHLEALRLNIEDDLAIEETGTLSDRVSDPILYSERNSSSVDDLSPKSPDSSSPSSPDSPASIELDTSGSTYGSFSA